MNTIETTPGGRGAAVRAVWTWGAEFRALFKLGWPLIVAQSAQNALLTTDVIMMGWLGPQFLAAGALANAFLFCFFLFGIGVTNAVAPMVAQALGARDYRSVRRTVRQGLWVAVLLFLALLPVLWNIKPIFGWLGQDPELAIMGERFIHYAVWLLLPAFLLAVLRSFLSAHGATRAILVITLCGVVVNALAGYALMFGNWGFPRLELAGAGIATTTVNTVMFLLMLGYVLGNRRFRRYRIFHNFFRADWPRFWALWRIGAPIGLMLLAEVGLFTAAALLQGWLGRDQVAAHAVALQLASIAFMVPLGLSQATTVRVGLALGEGNPEGIRKAGWASLVAGLAIMTTSATAFVIIPGTLTGLFLDPANPDNARPLALAVSYLIVAGLFQLADGTQVTMAAALRGLSDTKMPLVIALLGYWGLGFPAAYLLGFPLGLGGVGIWIGLAVGLSATAIILVVRFAMREGLGLTEKLVVGR